MMEIFIDFPGKIIEKFQVFKSKSSKKIRKGGPETSKPLEVVRVTKRKVGRAGWRRKEGKGGGKMGKK